MCGRIYQSLPLARLLQIAGTNNVRNGEHHTCSYNVCPTTYIPVIKPSKLYMDRSSGKDVQYNAQNAEELERDESRQVQFMKWGHHSKHNLVINGRIEELLNKRTFLNFIANRCVVIMQGYYQWNAKKEPFSLHPTDSSHFLVAALYTPQKEIIILTKDSTSQLKPIHHRMPVLLSHDEVNLWMDPSNTKDIGSIINKCILNKDKAVWKNVGFAKVSPNVSNTKEKSVKCLMTVQDYRKELDSKGLMKYWGKKKEVDDSGDKSASGAAIRRKDVIRQQKQVGESKEGCGVKESIELQMEMKDGELQVKGVELQVKGVELQVKGVELQVKGVELQMEGVEQTVRHKQVVEKQKQIIDEKKQASRQQQAASSQKAQNEASINPEQK